MQPLNSTSILFHLCSNEYDYIATALTPWHSYGVIAGIKKLEKDYGKKLFGLILIVKNFGEKYIIDETNFDDLNCDIKYYTFESSTLNKIRVTLKENMYIFSGKTKSLKRIYVLSQITPGFYFMSLAKRAYKDAEIVSVICDEGIGSYFGTNRVEKVTAYHGPLFKLKDFLEYQVIYPMGLKKLTKKNEIVKAELLRTTTDGTYVVNEEICGYFNEAIERYCVKTNNNRIQMPEKYIIINTQPLNSKYFDSEYDILDILGEVINVFSKCSYKVFIKPHPRENDIEKYRVFNAELITDCRTQEELNILYDSKPEYIVSMYSTTLISCPTACGVKTMCIGKLVCNATSCKSEYMEFIYEFEKKFCRITKIIQSYDELALIIS